MEVPNDSPTFLIKQNQFINSKSRHTNKEDGDMGVTLTDQEIPPRYVKSAPKIKFRFQF